MQITRRYTISANRAFLLPARFYASIRIMTVNVEVADRQGRPVQGLTSDDFKIFDNGRPRKDGDPYLGLLGCMLRWQIMTAVKGSGING